ncbi:MAG: hypothetical protein N2483_02675 [Burkholderiaceae bacterium]|nr:hypothetical protein [Burkholderiaceae bacterium]
MIVPIAMVRRVIEQHQLNTLAVWDTAERLRLFFAEGTTEEILEHLNAVHRDLSGAYLVKAYRRSAGKAGRPKAEEGTYSWVVRGAGGHQEQPERIGALPESLAMELATLRAKAELAARDEGDEGEEEEEEDEAGSDVLGKLVDLLAGILAPKPAESTVGGTVQRGHPSALTNDRMARILRAVKAAHAADPDGFASMESMLLQRYGQGNAAND